MVRTIVAVLAASVALGIVATPGLAAAGLLIVVLAPIALGWWIALGGRKPGTRTRVVARIRHHEFLGPGGPDDPFADGSFDVGSARDGVADDIRSREDHVPG
jgi:hypothetical protein